MLYFLVCNGCKYDCVCEWTRTCVYMCVHVLISLSDILCLNAETVSPDWLGFTLKCIWVLRFYLPYSLSKIK